jgi:hypothetical protein
MDIILRPGRPDDANACGMIVFEAFKSIASEHNFPLDALCRVHGHDRSGELQDAIGQGTARVVEHLGAVTAYATDIAYFPTP